MSSRKGILERSISYQDTNDQVEDLKEKVEQVREVVHNCSRNNIALVLCSCENEENMVDAAIDKLISPDAGHGCLSQWAVQGKKKPHASQTQSACSKSMMVDANTTRCGQSTPQALGVEVTVTITDQEEMAGGRAECPVNSMQGDEGNKDQQQGTKTGGVERDCVARIGQTPMTDGVRTSSQTKSDLTGLQANAAYKDVSRNLNNTSVGEEQHQHYPVSYTQVEQRNITSRASKRNAGGKRPIKKQRPPKRIRDKMKQHGATSVPSTAEQTPGEQRMEEKTERVEDKVEENELPQFSTRQQQFSPKVPLPSPQEPYRQHISVDYPYNPSEPSLRKLVKDLHRCDISIMRYQQILHQQCHQAMCNVQRVFAMLRIGLNAREEDIMRELQSVRQTASLILQRRKATAICLRKLSENATRLEEPQVQELKRQLKQFVTDRKVDEEIGTTRYFYGDPDDLLPQIMGFGRISTIQPSYTSWNENPWEAVEKSAIKVQLPDAPVSPLQSPTCSAHNANSPPCQEQLNTSNLQPQQPTTPPFHSSSGIDLTESLATTQKIMTPNNDDSPINPTAKEDKESSTVHVTKDSSVELVQSQHECREGDQNMSAAEQESATDKEEECGEVEDTMTTDLGSRDEVTAEEEKHAKICVMKGTELEHKETNQEEENDEQETDKNTDRKKEMEVESTKEREEKEHAGFQTSWQEHAGEDEQEVQDTQNKEETKEEKEEEENTYNQDTAVKTSAKTPPLDKQFKRGWHLQRPQSSPDLMLLTTTTTPSPQWTSATMSPSTPSRFTIHQYDGADSVKTETGMDHQKTGDESMKSCSHEEEYEEGEFGRRRKYSPEELAVIQERVRESLQQQGVFLYDPFTGKVNRTASSTKGSGLESEDYIRKKKTPTQLRRERKKRQRERERRQKEAENSKQQQQQTGQRSRADGVRLPPSSFDDSGIATSGSSSSQEEMSPKIKRGTGASDIKSITHHTSRPLLQRYRHCKPILLERPHPTRERVTILTGNKSTRDRTKGSTHM